MKIYEVELDPGAETSSIWIKTEGRIILSEDSCLSKLKEINVLEESSGIDMTVEVPHV
jgi:hypothetical protein